jgi:rRNA maturation endonuclease Nob1
MSTSQDMRDTSRVVHDRYRLCGHCGNFSSASEPQTFCMLCGTKLIDACPRCKEPIVYPTARFCPACGERLVTIEDPARQIV